MAKKKVKKVKQKAKQIAPFSIRFTEDHHNYFEGVAKKLLKERPMGSKISKTEAIYTLLSYGMKQFNKEFGDPTK